MLQSSSQNKKPSTHDSIEPLGQGRIIGRRPVGVVDIGSNSVRLVIYEGNSRALTVLFNEKVLSGLGKGLAQTNRLDGQAVSSALGALKRFRRLAEQAGVEALYPLATAASREAVNGPEFLAAAEVAISSSPADRDPLRRGRGPLCRRRRHERLLQAGWHRR